MDTGTIVGFTIISVIIIVGLIGNYALSEDKPKKNTH